jgi:hypothetical protein
MISSPPPGTIIVEAVSQLGWFILCGTVTAFAPFKRFVVKWCKMSYPVQPLACLSPVPGHPGLHDVQGRQDRLAFVPLNGAKNKQA